MAQHSDQLYCTLSVRKTYCIRLAFENPCVQRIRYVSTVSHRYTMHNKYCFPYRKLNWWIKSSSLNRRNALFIRWWLVHRWFRLSASAESGEQGFGDTYLIFIMVFSWQTYARNWKDLKFRTANEKSTLNTQFSHVSTCKSHFAHLPDLSAPSPTSEMEVANDTLQNSRILLVQIYHRSAFVRDTIQVNKRLMPNEKFDMDYL